MPELKPEEQDEPWLTIKQLGELLQIGEDKIRARVKANAWPHFRDGRTIRFTPDHVQHIADIGHQPVKRRKRSW